MRVILTILFDAAKDQALKSLAAFPQVRAQVCEDWAAGGGRAALTAEEENLFLESVLSDPALCGVIRSIRRDVVYDLAEIAHLPLVQVRKAYRQLDFVISNPRAAFAVENVCPVCCSADWRQVQDIEVDAPDGDGVCESDYPHDIIAATPNEWLLKGRALESARSLPLSLRPVSNTAMAVQVATAGQVKVPAGQQALGNLESCGQCKRMKNVDLAPPVLEARAQQIKEKGVRFREFWQPVCVDLSGVLLKPGFFRSDIANTSNMHLAGATPGIEDLEEKWRKTRNLFFATPVFLQAIGTSGLHVYPTKVI